MKLENVDFPCYKIGFGYTEDYKNFWGFWGIVDEDCLPEVYDFLVSANCCYYTIPKHIPFGGDSFLRFIEHTRRRQEQWQVDAEFYYEP